MEKLLSIIIPVYNVERFISACIESILSQNIARDVYEIVVVDDGSPDNSIEILNGYASKYENIRIIRQPNKGLSGARNTGLKNASGQYVWFVDSDDTVTDGSLQAILETLHDNIDMLGIQYRLVYDDSTLNKDICTAIVEDIKDGRFVTKYGGISIPVPFCVYRREFLTSNNLYFAEGKLHEDSEFKPRAVYLADRIKTISYVCYNYYKGNSDSITANHSYRNVDGYMYAAESLNTFCNNLTFRECKYLYKEVGRCVNGAIFSFVNMHDSVDKKKAKSRILNGKKVFRSMVKAPSISYSLEGLCLLVAPSFFLFLYPKLKNMK